MRTRLVGAAVGLALLGPVEPGRTAPALSADDRAAIGEVMAGIGLDADAHEWDRLLDRFAPRVSVDYTSLFGGTPLVQNREALVAGWRGFLPGFDATQHLIAVAAVRIDDPNHATATSNVRATHRIGRELWVVGGTYTHALVRSAEGWRVTFMRFSLAYEKGDRTLATRAAARAEQVNARKEIAR